MDQLKESVTTQNEYGERDALVTVFAISFEESEQEVRSRLETYFGENKNVAEAMTDLHQRIKKLLDKIEPEKRREWAVRFGNEVLQLMKDAAIKEDPYECPQVGKSKLLKVARIIFSKRVVVQRFVPILSDYYIEYDEARRESRFKAFLVRVEYYYRFAEACGLNALLSVSDKLLKIWMMLS
jgi:hypothetical protein